MNERESTLKLDVTVSKDEEIEVRTHKIVKASPMLCAETAFHLVDAYRHAGYRVLDVNTQLEA